MPFLNRGPAYFMAKGISGRAGSSSVLGEAGSVLVHCPQVFRAASYSLARSCITHGLHRACWWISWMSDRAAMTSSAVAVVPRTGVWPMTSLAGPHRPPALTVMLGALATPLSA